MIRRCHERPSKRSDDPKKSISVNQELELFELIFDSIYNGAMITDKDGFVIRINKPYADFLGIDAEESIGKHCTQVIENTRMYIVGKTGDPEINYMQKIRGKNILVHRIPIKKKRSSYCCLGIGYVQGFTGIEKTSGPKWNCMKKNF